MGEKMNLLLFSGSLRKGSLNKKLLRVAEKILLNLPDCKTTVADLKELNFPVYDADIEVSGFPRSVEQLGQMIRDCDGLVIASPEYNASMAGSFKNAIDWVSRLRPMPLAEKPVLLMGASPGPFGSIRAQVAARATFDTLGCFLHPSSFALSKADQAFTAEEDLKEAALKSRLEETIKSYVQFAQKLPMRPS